MPVSVESESAPNFNVSKAANSSHSEDSVEQLMAMFNDRVKVPWSFFISSKFLSYYLAKFAYCGNNGTISSFAEASHPLPKFSSLHTSNMVFGQLINGEFLNLYLIRSGRETRWKQWLWINLALSTKSNWIRRNSAWIAWRSVSGNVLFSIFVRFKMFYWNSWSQYSSRSWSHGLGNFDEAQPTCVHHRW